MKDYYNNAKIGQADTLHFFSCFPNTSGHTFLILNFRNTLFMQKISTRIFKCFFFSWFFENNQLILSICAWIFWCVLHRKRHKQCSFIVLLHNFCIWLKTQTNKNKQSHFSEWLALFSVFLQSFCMKTSLSVMPSILWCWLTSEADVCGIAVEV